MAPEKQDRYTLAARILELLGPELAAEGYDLVDVRVFQGGGRQQVRLYVDLPGDARIDLDGCAGASRSASLLLEAANLFGGPWILEVSSPGVRPPLRREAHFLDAVGSNVLLKWRSPQESTQRLLSVRGRLVSVNCGQLTIIPGPWAVDQKADLNDDPAICLDASVGGRLITRPEASQGANDTARAAPMLRPIIVPLTAVVEANLDQDFDVQAVIRLDRRQQKESKQAERRARRQRSATASRQDNRAIKARKPESGELEMTNEERDGCKGMFKQVTENEPDKRNGS